MLTFLTNCVTKFFSAFYFGRRHGPVPFHTTLNGLTFAEDLKDRGKQSVFDPVSHTGLS